MLENDVTHRSAHRHFENARANNMAADANEFQTARTPHALCREPLNAAREDLRHVHEGLDVIDDRGLLPQTGLDRKGWLVARLGAVAFNGFHESSFFPTDVAARADENFQIKIEAAAEDVRPKKTISIAVADFLRQDFFLKRILVTNIDDAALCAGDECRNHHALDQKMREMRHDEAIFNRSGFAFVGVTDDVLHGIGLLAHKIPLHARGKSGSAHASKFSGFQEIEDLIPGFRLGESAHSAIMCGLTVGVRLASDA